MIISSDHKSIIDERSVISFDIFDTLIRRTCGSPRDIFKLVEEECHYLGVAPLRSIAQARIQAEKHALDAAMEAGREDVDIDEIYRTLVEVHNFTSKDADQIKRSEISMETKLIRPRPYGLALFKYAQMRNKRIILTSDMYLPRGIIISFLESCGIYGYDNFYLSNQIGLSKRTGRLFSHILIDMNIDASDLVHVGDNMNGDVKMPSELGISVIHTPRSQDAYNSFSEMTKRTREVISKHNNRSASCVQSVISNYLFDSEWWRKDNLFRNSPFDLGYTILGPLAAGFSSWIKNHAELHNLDRILFMSRDGRVFMDAFNELYPELKNRTEYVYCSRRAVKVPQVQDFSDIERIVKAPIYSTSIRDWIHNNFGLQFNYIDNFNFQKFNIENSHYMIGNKFDRDILMDIMRDMYPEVIDVSKIERTNLFNYVSHVASGANNIGIVDIGYAGTMQKAFSNILKRDVTGLYLSTFETISNNIGDTFKSFGYLSELDSDAAQKSSIVRYRFLYETTICAPEDSVVNISVDDEGRFIPNTRSAHLADRRKQVISEIHAGALRFVRDFKEDLGDFDICLPGPVAEAYMNAFFSAPMKKDALLLNDVVFEDAYGPSLIRYLMKHPPITSQRYDVIWREGMQAVNGSNSSRTPMKKKPDLDDRAIVASLNTEKETIQLVQSQDWRVSRIRVCAETFISGGDLVRAQWLLKAARNRSPSNKNIRQRLMGTKYPILLPLSKPFSV